MSNGVSVASIGEEIIRGKKSRSHNVVESWWDCPFVPPEVLREWVAEKSGEVFEDCEAVRADAPRLRDEKNEVRLCAASMLMNGEDFLELAKIVAPHILDDYDQSVAIGFASGLRLGMAYERLLSLADGRYHEKWLRQESRQRAGQATKELTSDEHVLILKSTFAKFKGQVKAVEKTANELFDRHGIKSRRGKKISAKTIGRRLAELEILDNA